jgi:hypothetical protein
MKGHISILLLLITGLLLLTGCVPEFENPLSAPKVMKADPALLGTWKIDSDEAGEITQVSFFGRESGWMDIVFVDGPSRYDGVEVSIFEAYTANVNKDTFICLRPRKQDDQEQTNGELKYLLAHYHLSKEGILSVNLFDQGAVERIIEEGLLKGEYKNVNGKKDLVKVVSSSDEIASAIVEKGVESFISKEDTVKFRKLK